MVSFYDTRYTLVLEDMQQHVGSLECTKSIKDILDGGTLYIELTKVQTRFVTLSYVLDHPTDKDIIKLSIADSQIFVQHINGWTVPMFYPTLALLFKQEFGLDIDTVQVWAHLNPAKVITIEVWADTRHIATFNSHPG